MKKQAGERPLFGRLPKNAEWRLLEDVAITLKDFLSSSELALIRDIAQKRDMERYQDLGSVWGIHSISPLDKVNTQNLACKYQLSSMLKKTQWDENLTPAQIAKATDTFWSYERRMSTYNAKGIGRLAFGEDPKTVITLTRMRHFISTVLGRLDRERVTKYGRHGPGSTYSLSSQFGHNYYKNATIPYEVTSKAITEARLFIYKDERWRRAIWLYFTFKRVGYTAWHPLTNIPKLLERLPFKPVYILPPNDVLFRVVPGNRISFVPKKADEARSMAIEPAMNVVLQLGVDGHIRRRLLKFGINIQEQSINQELARKGSIDNSLSTIDLQGASANIATSLVELLFPLDWVEYLAKLRSDIGEFPDGRLCFYQQLSSMGNGYTFAVETLIFAAATYAANPNVEFGTNAHVYGDDIVLPSSSVSDLYVIFDLCGFLVNQDKSFTKINNVRESCGADYRYGVNIRPVFLKFPLGDLDVAAFYSFHNRMLEWYSRILYTSIVEPMTKLRSFCSTKWRLYGPPDSKDQSSYLHVSHPIYGRTKEGLYPFDRAIVVPRTYKQPGNEWFVILNATLCDTPPRSIHSRQLLTTGNVFDVTKRNSYKYRTKKRSSFAFAWPDHCHEL